MNKPFPSTNFPGLFYGTKKVENSPAFAPRKDWGGMNQSAGIRKDTRTPLFFKIRNGKRGEDARGGFSSAPSKDAEDSSTMGVWGGFLHSVHRKIG